MSPNVQNMLLAQLIQHLDGVSTSRSGKRVTKSLHRGPLTRTTTEEATQLDQTEISVCSLLLTEMYNRPDFFHCLNVPRALNLAVMRIHRRFSSTLSSVSTKQPKIWKVMQRPHVTRVPQMPVPAMGPLMHARSLWLHV